MDSQYRIEGLEDVPLTGQQISMTAPEFQKGDMVRVIGGDAEPQLVGALGTIEAHVGSRVWLTLLSNNH